MANILLHLLPASFYLASAVLAHRTTHNKQNHPQQSLPRLCLLLGLLAHAGALASVISSPDGFYFGLSIALSLSLWLAMLIYGLESLSTPLQPLLQLAAPVAAIASLLPALLPGHPHELEAFNWAYRLHIVLAMLAYSLFTLAVFHALLLAIAERQIHKATLDSRPSLPPLLSLERLLFRLISTAFVFLTLTVSSGLFFSEYIFNKPFSLTHKAVFGIASWLLFATLLAGRHWRGWRGRLAKRWLLAGFFCLILAYAGSRFVLEFLLQRSI